MKHWEEAALLTDVLDRHVARLLQEIPSSDWTLFWHIEPFLRLLAEEPVLSGFVQEYVNEEAELLAELSGKLDIVREAIAAQLTANEPTLRALAEKSDPRDPQRVDEALACLCATGSIELAKCTSALESIVGFLSTNSGSDSQLADLRNKLSGLLTQWCQLEVRYRCLDATHPGSAYQQLHQASRNLQYRNAPIDSDRNKNARRIHGFIRESELWLGLEEGMVSQPEVVRLQRVVRTLHLALVTSLARGRSRWATVKRFAARCESIDRRRLCNGLKDASGKPEAFLTLEFARYLFDAGYNPLVDAAACGLRPDVLDVTAEPAVYVEAKQYENVGDAIAADLRKGLAQTLNTWSRLANRWCVPEAFLLLFRRSGRPLELENSELRVNGGRLYVLCVDLADASESGSRAESPVRIDLKALLEVARARGSSNKGEENEDG